MARRRIKKARVAFVSLVPAGANGLPVLYKSEDKTATFSALTKAGPNFDEKGEIHALVYVPETPDRDGDVASAEVVKEMAYSFMQEGSKVDVRHDGKALPREEVYVAENFIVQKEDTRFHGWKDHAGQPVDATEGWGMVLKVEDEDLRKQYREGKWAGVSLAAPEAEVEVLKEDSASALDTFMDRLLKRIAGEDVSKEEDPDMTPEEMKKALEESNKALVTSLAKEIPEIVKGLLSKEAPKDPPKDEEGFTGDPTDVKAVKKHLAKVRKAKLAKSVDWNDPEAVEQYLESVEKDADADDGGGDDEDPKVARLEAELAKLRKASKAGGKSSNDPAPGPEAAGILLAFEDLSKERKEEAIAGVTLASDINRQRGY